MAGSRAGAERLVSVIVPVHNGADFIGECLDGLAGQTHGTTQVIVVDDGSTDGTADVVRAHSAVTYLYQENAGQVEARRRGLARARGDFVAFNDHDDVMLPERLERQVAYLEDHPDATAVLCRHEILLSGGLTETPAWVPRDQVYGDLGGLEWSSMLCRREALSEGFFVRPPAMADGIHVLTGLRDSGHQIAVLDERLWLRRYHGHNMTSDRDAMRHDMLKFVRDRARGR